MKKELVIKKMLPQHWNEVSRILKQGIDTGLASLEIDVPSWEYWDNNHLKNSRFIAVLENEIVGWATLSPVSMRKAYAGVAEISIYVDNLHKGKNVGSILMKNLIKNSEKCNIWTLQAVVFPENIPSIKFHEKFEFRHVGHREKISNNRGKWQDTILLERRSKIIGV